MLSEERKVKKMGNVSTKNSQAGTVYSPGGCSPTICAGTHGYAIGYNGVPIKETDKTL